MAAMKVRPAILFTTAYGAGLATGLLHFGGPLGVVGVTLAAAVVARKPLATLLTAAALLGRLSGELAWLREADQCVTRLPAGRLRIAVRLLEPADSTGGVIAVQPVRAGCTGLVSSRWPLGHPMDAGLVVEVTAQWIPRPAAGRRPSGTFVIG